GSSMNSMPALLHASSSVGLMGREAPVMAVSPRQNFLKPPPVPDTPMVTRPPCLAWYSSATAWLMGYTVLEPSIWMVPVGLAAPSCAALPSPALSSLLHPEEASRQAA